MFALAFGSNFDFVFVNTLAFELKSNGQTSKKTSQTQETQIGTAAFFYCLRDYQKKPKVVKQSHVGLISTTGECKDTGITDNFGDLKFRKYYY